MFKFDKIGHLAISAIATVLFSTTMVLAAIGPARAVETAPVVVAQGVAQPPISDSLNA